MLRPHTAVKDRPVDPKRPPLDRGREEIHLLLLPGIRPELSQPTVPRTTGMWVYDSHLLQMLESAVQIVRGAKGPKAGIPREPRDVVPDEFGVLLEHVREDVFEIRCGNTDIRDAEVIEHGVHVQAHGTPPVKVRDQVEIDGIDGEIDDKVGDVILGRVPRVREDGLRFEDCEVEW